jgi:protein-tyrosine-phosphatase
MQLYRAAITAFAVGVGWVTATTVVAEDKRLESYITARIDEFEQITPERRERLIQVSEFIASQRASGRPLQLTFVCTHNSRRSQMSQVWAAIAAEHYGVRGVESFSGGTEKTAFNARAVAALQRAGVRVERSKESTDEKNPGYDVHVPGREKPLVCFSKVYSDTPNPSADFAAVMTCSEADKKCPVVSGAKTRIALPFDDPKSSDDTPDESKAYDQRCAQIARELLYVFSQLSTSRESCR